MKKIIDMLKSMTNSKKKVFALALSVCVVVLSIASSSIAYFTDTDEYTNAFTSGNVAIKLMVNSDDITTGDPNYTDKVIPGKSIPKATSIKVESTSETAYLGAVITVTNPANIFNGLDIKNFIYGLNTTDATVTVEEVKSGDVVTSFIIRVVFTDAVAAGGSVNVFSSIVPPASWDHAEIDHLGDLDVTVKAYAVQKEGLASADAALKEAFPEAFPTP